MLETFSRTVRNYVPTSIPVPAAAPSPPRVSKPVSFGSFMAPPGPSILSSADSNPLGATVKGNQPAWRMRGSGQLDSADVDVPATFSPESEDCETTTSTDQPLTTYPTSSEGDAIMWSRWDTLIENNSRAR